MALVLDNRLNTLTDLQLHTFQANRLSDRIDHTDRRVKSIASDDPVRAIEIFSRQRFSSSTNFHRNS